MPVTITSRFCRGGDPFDYPSVRRDVRILEGSRVAYEQTGVESPETWSERAIEQPSRLYFRTSGGVREHSIGQLVRRVTGAIALAAVSPDVGTPLVTPEDADILRRELAWLALDQRLAWNTPVWVNAGADLPEGERPQCSACFIQSVEDTMESITALQVSETMLFRRGSGTGTNWSPLRPANWQLSRGGTASGPTSFMRGFDAWAGITKSGGSSRRAAKMNILDVSHPDIFEFIGLDPADHATSKVLSGRMIAALVSSGMSGDFNDVATAWMPYQNGNHSVRVTRAFMSAVRADEAWPLRWGGVTTRLVSARELWSCIARAAWETGCPGLQFHDTINDMHTCPNSGEINASNPCSEYMFLDDSACDLASLNLRKFWNPETRRFDAEAFAAAVRLATISLEAIVSLSGYPTEKIADRSHRFRPVGLGYSNLGALLMVAGLPYDSDEGRSVAASVTALMTAVAYQTSAEIARDAGGPFPDYAPNRDAMLAVVARHRSSMESLMASPGVTDLDHLPSSWVPVLSAARMAGDVALRIGEKHGFRNAQATVLAPAGTISFVMDCDTTGIEPDIGLVKRKRLAGGGELRMVNQSVHPALVALGASQAEAAAAVMHLSEQGALVLPAHLSQHADVFGCAFVPPGRDDAWPLLSPEAHVRMVAAVQPHLSGAVSKTVNMPSSSTAQDVERIYDMAEQLGLKAVAIFRDGSKGSQPLQVGVQAPAAPAAPSPRPAPEGEPWGTRRRMPAEADAKRRRFTLEGHDLYVHVGFWPDGNVGEFFFTSSAKEGTTLSGVLDALARAVSLCLQHGAPLDKILDDFAGTRFEPAGWTGDPDFPHASSFLDAVAQWARRRFLSPAQVPQERPSRIQDLGGRQCPRGCGQMRQTGTCWMCSCGESSGGCG